MPDNETNEDNANKRPKRRAAQRTYVSYENTSAWAEDKDLKKALLASLQTAKKSNSVYGQKNKKTTNEEKKIERNDNFSKVNHHNSSQTIVCKDNQPLVVDNNLLSRRARVSAQRKFAQSSGFSTNSPVSTPIKTGFVPSSNVVELFPNQRPNTEDFLTFLCLRRSPILPPNLDFIRLNAIEEKKRETDSENISSDELDQNIDKYTTCGQIRASVDRRGSASSTVSKTTSLSSRTSLQISNRKKSEINRNEYKSQTSFRPKRSQSSESGLKNIGSNSNQKTKQSQSKTKTSLKSNETKAFDSLKEKYKQQRIEKKSSNPSKSVKIIKKIDSKAINENQSKDKKKSETKGIQTRQQSRNDSYHQRVSQSVTKVVEKVKSRTNSSSGQSERVLRSHHSDPVFTQSLPKSLKKANNLLVQNSTKKKVNNSLNSSQIGIRPKTRKAKPVVPLIDYYFDSEFETDSETKEIKSETKKDMNSNQFKSKNLKNNSKDNKNNKISKTITDDKSGPGRPKGSTKWANKSKTSLNAEPRRLTRSSRPLSPPKDSKDLERERLIKQQIIAIERKHKRLRRCPSDQSLHSSASSSSSSSSESLPNSLSSSSSINNTRLTRSLEHLKKIRDIAAKLKREQNNKKEDKTKTNGKNEILKHNKKIVKRNANTRQNVLQKKISDNCVKDSKINNKTKKEIKNSKERTVTKRMSATSDTDCDTQTEATDDVMSEMNATEDSMASTLDQDMERASIVIQDMAEDINSLLVNSSETDLQYGSTEHIQGLMTSEFSGAFSEETVTTASAILLPSDCHSEYSYVNQTDESIHRSTVDASTNTTEDDILEESEDLTQSDVKYDSNSKTLSVGTQTNSSVQTDQTDGPIE